MLPSHSVPAGWLQSRPVFGVSCLSFGNPYTATTALEHVDTGTVLGSCLTMEKALRVRNMARGIPARAAARLARLEMDLLIPGRALVNTPQR